MYRKFAEWIRALPGRRPQLPLAIVASASLALLTAALFAGASLAEVVLPPDQPRPLASLKTVPVPEPSNLYDFVQDKPAAIRLGKALFWEMQVSTDDKVACASCHFQAGSDSLRTVNQLNPGPDRTFQISDQGSTLQASDFPFTKHADENDPQSPIVSDADDIAGSQGVLAKRCAESQTSEGPGTMGVRQVTGRNAPSVINAVFNFRNFWDGRAAEDFNGVTPFGARDPDAGIWKTVSPDGTMEKVRISLDHASLASQALGPPLNSVEMSCDGRDFADVGHELLNPRAATLGRQRVDPNDSVRRPIAERNTTYTEMIQQVFRAVGHKLINPTVVPLGKQRVDPNDSVLGPIAKSRVHPSSKGLNTTYTEMIQQAFRPEYWNSPRTVTVGSTQVSQMEANFSLFFGLSIQLYEATLVSDQTPFDRFASGDTSALTAQQQEGLQSFTGAGRCANCHGGAELTNASVSNVESQRLERMLMGNGGCAIYDNGFYNIGVRPTTDDPGVGGSDPFGNPLSDTRMAMAGRFTDPNLSPPLGEVSDCDSQAVVDGAFKTPGLRNIELTGPYFHNGGKATLRQVVDFYNRGGDFANQNIADLDPDMSPIGLTDAQSDALVAFLRSLTDERVRWQKAPFDHPELCAPNGQTINSDGSATDRTLCIPAVGARGAVAPSQPFLNGDPAQPPAGDGGQEPGRSRGEARPPQEVTPPTTRQPATPPRSSVDAPARSDRLPER